MLDPSSFAERTLGCTLIGVILTTLLYGCSLGQTIIYLQRYQRDSAYIKVLVVTLWLFNTCKTAIDIQFLWNALVQEHSHFARLFKVADIFGAEYVIGAVISFIAQCYFLNIIWKLLRSKWYGRALTIVGYISTLISLASSIGGVYEVYSTTKLIKIEKSILIQGSLHVAAACFTDILITTSLCVFLRRSRTGFRRTETILSTLMVWTTNRGVLVTIVQILQPIAFIVDVRHGTLITDIFYLPTGGLYVASMLAMLNARTRTGGDSVTPICSMVTTSFLETTAHASTSILIHVDIERSETKESDVHWSSHPDQTVTEPGAK